MRSALLLSTLALGIVAACGGPEQPPNPESNPAVEAPGYEPGMTTGESDEVIDAQGPLEEYVTPEGEPPNTAPVTDTSTLR